MTPNDAGDADTGPNNGQNYPMITTVTPGGSTTNIQGLLNSTASTVFDIDLFSTAACIPFPQAYLQGENYLGTFQLTTDGSGNATFSHDVPFVLQPGQLVTATATDPNGNTSEFSQRILFIVSPGSGPPAGGTNAELAGMLFESGATVTVGGVPATGVVFNSPASLTALMPARPAGSLNDVTISNPSGLAGTLRNGWIADFGDTPGSQQFYAFITKLVANQITVGCGGGNYCPDATVTRQQMAVFLLKGEHGLCYAPPACTPGFFDDVPCPSTYAAWIQALATEGITGGCGGNSYCPTNPVRRDQMAVFLLKSKHGSTLPSPGLHTTGNLSGRRLPGHVHRLDRRALHGKRRRRLRQRQLLPDEPEQPGADGCVHYQDLQPSVTKGRLPVGPVLNSADSHGRANRPGIGSRPPPLEPRRRQMRTLVSALSGLVFLAVRLTAATVTVNDAGDATNACATTGVGTCTLRDALTFANANAGSTIAFSISGAGVHTIQPATPYPSLLAPMTIDGFTQPGSSANTNGPGLADNSVHRIELDGTHACGASPAILDFGTGSDGSVVRGLVLNRCNASAIRVAFSTTTGHVIEGNFLGTDPTGLIASPNTFGVLIDIGAMNVTIGGTTAASRNVLSGNIAGIGIGNGFDNGGSGHHIQGNFIGTDASGAAALPNGIGISMHTNVKDSTIGGDTPGARNVISGNTGTGVGVSGFLGDPTTSGNFVVGNYIGTDVTGSAPLGNAGDGIYIGGFANTIGGGNPGEGNVIAANLLNGIEIIGGNGNTSRATSSEPTPAARCPSGTPATASTSPAPTSSSAAPRPERATSSPTTARGSSSSTAPGTRSGATRSTMPPDSESTSALPATRTASLRTTRPTPTRGPTTCRTSR